MHITLLIPNLLWPATDDPARPDLSACPALETLLVRGRLCGSAPLGLEQSLCRLFGHDPDAACAPFRRLGEMATPDDKAAARWLCADPVHLHFRRNRLFLVDGRQLDILPEEVQQLLAALHAELPDIGFFDATSPECWYFQPADPALPPLFAPPLATLAGDCIDEVLPEVLDAPDWRRLLTAVQTVLHAHPVNRQREAAGRLTINSLWLWGDGALPARRESRFDGLWSTLPLARGLARAAGVPTHPLPSDAAHFLAHAAPGTEQLIVLDDLSAALRHEDGPAWRDALAALESRWFVPLKNALAAGQLQHVHLHVPGASATLDGTCSRADLWKFWRRHLRLPEPCFSQCS